MNKKPPRSPAAKSLMQGQYQQKIVPSKKKVPPKFNKREVKDGKEIDV